MREKYSRIVMMKNKKKGMQHEDFSGGYSADRCSLLPHPVVVVVFLRRRDSGSGSASCGESALTDSVPLLFSILMQPISSVRFLGASSSLFLD